MGILELIAGVILTAILIVVLYRIACSNSETVGWCFAHRAVLLAILVVAFWPTIRIGQMNDSTACALTGAYVILVLTIAVLAELYGYNAAAKRGRN